jgi:membrane associated rhomboid family serine protease
VPRTTCNCGQVLAWELDQANLALRCPECGRAVVAVTTDPPGQTPSPGDFVARLVIEDGPQRLRDLILLGGYREIQVGRQAGRHILLPDETVSRLHCRLVRLAGQTPRWKIEDAGSRAGLLVNDRGVREAELHDGDQIRIGSFQLRYLCDTKAAARLEQEQAISLALRPVCPACGRRLLPEATICTDCRIYIATGKPVVVSRNMHRERLEDRLWLFISHLSWLPPLCTGIMPVASEAYSTRSRVVIWVIVALTVLASLLYLPVAWSDERADGSPALLNLMCWSGSRDELGRYIQDQQTKIEQELDEARRSAGNSTRELDAIKADLPRMLAEAIPPQGVQFRWYQLLTHGWLHGGVAHLLGNLLFLLLFGLRVNEAIGTVRMLLVYPLLMAASGFTQAVAQAQGPLMPLLGASGAIMGLAGVYVVLFPLQYIHVAAWFQGYFLTGFQCLFRVFSVRGIWALAVLVIWSDAIPMLFRLEDSIGHWAHVGGFLSGIALGLVLLVTRQAKAMGGDILSVTLGRRAWPLVGRPGGAVEAPPRSM